MRIYNKGEIVNFKHRTLGLVYGEVLRKRLKRVKVGALGLGWYTWVHADRLTPANFNKG